MKTKWDRGFPELPPGYVWAKDGIDIDLIKADKVPEDYPNTECSNILVSWLMNGILIQERSIKHNRYSGFTQSVASQKEGLAIMAMRIWLGMNEP